MTFEHEYEDTEVAPVEERPDPLGEVLARRSRDGWELVAAYWVPMKFGGGGTHRNLLEARVGYSEASRRA
jgi:hypothetical protein